MKLSEIQDGLFFIRLHIVYSLEIHEAHFRVFVLCTTTQNYKYYGAFSAYSHDMCLINSYTPWRLKVYIYFIHRYF